MGDASSLVAIVGATGTGKSDLSLELAQALAEHGRAAEIVNADAMQLYRGMDVGTAKLPPAGRRGITHHLLDVLDVTDEQVDEAGLHPQPRAGVVVACSIPLVLAWFLFIWNIPASACSASHWAR